MPSPPDLLDETDHADSDSSSLDQDGAGVGAVEGKRIFLIGRFGGMNQRQAGNVLRSYNAVMVEQDAEFIDWVVIGAEESPIAEADLLTPRLRDASARGELEVLRETDLWQRLGLVEFEQSVRRFHTPAMLAHLLGVSVHVIRRWHRRGLIKPIHTLHQLPYFDFQEVATARRLAQWISSGESPKAIEQRLVELVEVLPELQRPLDQLSILVEGKRVLLRDAEALLEPSGQLRFDFEAMDQSEQTLDPSTMGSGDGPSVLSIYQDSRDSEPVFIESGGEQDELLAQAFAAEDAGDLHLAVDLCHAVLARDGPRADIDFQLGELLYRMGDPVAARERYYAAIESDPDFVEARASLGSVLAETGQADLAVAAFRGAIELHEDYSEVHYNLANLLSELGRDVEARYHWTRFLALAFR